MATKLTSKPKGKIAIKPAELPKGVESTDIKTPKNHQDVVNPNRLRPAYMESSDDATFSGSVVFIHSPAGYGKTTLATTISQQCPWPLPAKKKTTISDIFYIGTDAKGSLGLRTLGINLENVLDQNLLRSRQERWEAMGYSAPPTVTQAFLSSLDIAREWSLNNPGGHLIIDTVSKLDSDLWVEFGSKIDEATGQLTQVNGVQVAGMILNFTRYIHDRILSMPFETVIYLAHEKPLYEFEGKLDNKNTQRVKDAGKALEGATVIPAVTGQSVGVYQKDAIGEFSLDAPRINNVRTRYVYAVPFKGREVKNRFEAALADKEEPCLRRIVDKVKNYQP